MNRRQWWILLCALLGGAVCFLILSVIALPIIIVLVIALPTIALPAIALPALALSALSVVGFGALGPVAGSFAAAWQAMIGNVAAGSLFAILQSMAMTGVIPLWYIIAGGVGIVVSALWFIVSGVAGVVIGALIDWLA